MIKTLSLDIAKRYLFAKKSTNAINLITGISILGISIGTAALVLVLSVFNGFENLLSSLLNNFNPDLKITPIEGKYFEVSDSTYQLLAQVEGVELISRTIEEVALFEYDSTPKAGVIKGVDTQFEQVTNIDEAINRGKFQLSENNISYGVIGSGLYVELAISMRDKLTPIKIHMLNNKKKTLPGKDFKTMLLYPSGTFAVQSESDYQYIIASYDFVSNLLESGNKLSALEIKTKPNADTDNIAQKLNNILGEGYTVKNRYQMDEGFLKLMNIEKWVSFMIVSLTLFLVAFNLVGALWMIILEKKKDIAILKSLGMQNNEIKNIFLWQGLLICLIGVFIGFVFSLLFYVAQSNLGIIPIPEGFIIDAYPMKLKISDLIIVFFTVVIIGVLASILPSSKAANFDQSIRSA